MNPVIALIGRPNVGKSTLFNRLTRTRNALVADQAGLTRDRNYGLTRAGVRPCIVIDTGGLTDEKEGLTSLIMAQALRAVDEADVILFIVDGRAGLTAADDTPVLDVLFPHPLVTLAVAPIFQRLSLTPFGPAAATAP